MKEAGFSLPIPELWNKMKNLWGSTGGSVGKLTGEQAARFAGAPNVGAGKASKALTEAKAVRATGAAASRKAELARRFAESRKANEARGLYVGSPA